MKTYKGDPDAMFESEEWKNLGYWVDQENKEEWFVFLKDQQHGNDWVTLKVVANGRVQRKANYWFTRNNQNGKIGFSRDLAIMADHRPQLYSNVMRIVCEEI